MTTREQGLKDELAYWESWLETKGLQWPEEYRARLDPTTPLQDEIRALLPQTGDVRILDVGAGPLTWLGKVWPGRTVDIFPIDPLANEYTSLLCKYGLDAPEPTRLFRGEDVGRVHNPFDLAHARNSLDHAEDPLKCIQGMLDCVKPGGVVYLAHAIDEGHKQGYAGLHQHNFYPGWCPVDTAVRELYLQTRGERINVCHAVNGLDCAPRVWVDGDWVFCTMRKR